MADKSTREGLLELIKTVREVALKKSEVNSRDIAKELVKAIREEVTDFETQIIQMRKLEQAGMKKSLFGLPSSTPSDVEAKTAPVQSPIFKAMCKNCKTEMSPVEYIHSRPSGTCKKCGESCKKSELRKDAMVPPPVPAPQSVHPVFNKDNLNQANYAVISGQNPKFPQAVQMQGGNQALENEFKTRGWDYTPIKGMYDEPEDSYFVPNPDVNALRDLGGRLGQESVLFANGGQNRLLMVNGPNAGKYHPGSQVAFHGSTPPENYYSTFEYNGQPQHWTNNIDFDQWLPYDETQKSEGLKKSVFDILAPKPVIGSQIVNALGPKFPEGAFKRDIGQPGPTPVANPFKGKSDVVGSVIPPKPAPKVAAPAIASSPKPGTTPSIIPGQPEAPQVARVAAPQEEGWQQRVNRLANKSEMMIDVAHEGDPKKREVEKGANPKAKLPGDKKSKKIPAEGSGGELKKESMSSTAPAVKPSGMNMKMPTPVAPTLKPEGIPGAKAGEAPGSPKPPSAPGAAKPTFGKADELEKGFVKPVRTGTKVQQQKEDLAWVGASHHSPAISHAAAKAKMPTMEDHAQRASMYGDFMPPGKFGKV